YRWHHRHLLTFPTRRSSDLKGAIGVIQEIFGVNAHIRDVVDRFADAGYVAIAPAFFDHLESDVELDYDAAGIARGRALIGELDRSEEHTSELQSREKIVCRL